MYKIRDTANDHIYVVDERPRWVAGVWECGSDRFVDETGAQFEIVIEIVPAKINAIGFMLLFSVAERLAIEASIDPVVQNFYTLVKDPRLETVDLGLPAVIVALNYIESAGLIAVGRAAEILGYQP